MGYSATEDQLFSPEVTSFYLCIRKLGTACNLFRHLKILSFPEHVAVLITLW